VIIFGSVRFLSKKVTKPNLKKKPKPVQTDQFRFGLVFFGQKPVWLGFLGLAQFFPI
jgi:uncharacterized protein YneF (UPF0154 family)